MKVRQFFPLPRWTVKAKAFKSIIDNYPLLLQTFEEDLEDSVMTTEMRARINGIISIMYKFDYYFGFELGHFVLKYTDNSAQKLQKSNLNAAQGHEMAMMTVKALKEEESDENFEIFFNMVTENAKKKGVEDAVLLRKRKIPSKLADSLESPPLYLSVKEKYKALYLEALKTIISNVNQRFDKGYEIVMNLENLLLKSAKGENYENELKTITDFYGSDLNKDDLKTQLLIYRSKFKELKKEKIVLDDVVELLKKPGYSDILSEIATVIKLVCVLPATDAESERIFSKLKLVKTPIRNSMKQDRLNDIMMINVHSEEAKSLSLAAVANEFAAKNDRRKEDFGIDKFE